MNEDTEMLRLCIASELHCGIGEEGLVKGREGERKQCGGLEEVASLPRTLSRRTYDPLKPLISATERWTGRPLVVSGDALSVRLHDDDDDLYLLAPVRQ